MKTVVKFRWCFIFCLNINLRSFPSVHEDAGVSVDCNGSWAIAIWKVLHSVEIFSAFLNTFLVTSPCNISSSDFSDEIVLEDMFNVMFLGMHFVIDTVVNLSRHFSHSSLCLSSMMDEAIKILFVLVSIIIEFAFACFGTFTHESFSWWSIG